MKTQGSRRKRKAGRTTTGAADSRNMMTEHRLPSRMAHHQAWDGDATILPRATSELCMPRAGVQRTALRPNLTGQSHGIFQHRSHPVWMLRLIGHNKMEDGQHACVTGEGSKGAAARDDHLEGVTLQLTLAGWDGPGQREGQGWNRPLPSSASLLPQPAHAFTPAAGLPSPCPHCRRARTGDSQGRHSVLPSLLQHCLAVHCQVRTRTSLPQSSLDSQFHPH